MKLLKRTFIWSGGLLMLVIFVLALDIVKIEINTVFIILAIGSILIVAFLISLIIDLFRPAQKVTMRTYVSLEQLQPLGNNQQYKLAVDVEYEISNKKRVVSIPADSRTVRFDTGAHPDAYEYCMKQIRDLYNKNLKKGKKKYKRERFSISHPEIPYELRSLKG